MESSRTLNDDLAANVTYHKKGDSEKVGAMSKALFNSEP